MKVEQNRFRELTRECKLWQNQKVQVFWTRLAQYGISSVEILVDISELRGELQTSDAHFGLVLRDRDTSE